MTLQYCQFAERNRLIDAVAEDLGVDAYKAGCRALGIIDKLLKAPLWRFLVSAEPFHKVVNVYWQITEWQAAWAEDSSDFVDGSARPFSGAMIHSTIDVYDQLFAPHASDTDTKHLQSPM